MSITGLVSGWISLTWIRGSAPILVRGFIGFFGADCFEVTGFLAVAALFVAGIIPADRLEAGGFAAAGLFGAGRFEVAVRLAGVFATARVRGVVFGTFRVAAVFFGVTAATRFLVVAALPTGLRDCRTAVLSFTFAVLARAAFCLAAEAFGGDTLTSPRMGRTGFRAFVTAAFTVGRRVDLLREVEAMGTTLGTVEAW
jgi:hypothetical protein